MPGGALTTSMTIRDILETHGHPLGSHRRTTCPIHGGANDSAFSYTDEVWFCWSCGAKGGVKALLEHFEPTRRPGGFEGLPERIQDYAREGGYAWVPLDGLRPSTWLLARSRAIREWVEDAAAVLHQRALWKMDHGIPRALAIGGPDLFEEAAVAWERESYRLWLAEEVLGCQCL